ncbi:YidH family protein [Rubrolithibacter danxiaensis]|uniref:YidH family protein n=1 Tax=Rubrolithibacter danxiaensis TaxID=3390805 RepID=UPI003BF91302
MEPIKEDLKKINPNDHLANERTFLAWIRTSIAIMGFGFVVVKFALFIKQLSFVLGEKAAVVPGKGYSSLIGILLVAIGAIVALLAFLRYRIIEKKLLKGTYFPSFSLSLVLTFSILIISILLMLYLVPSV